MTNNEVYEEIEEELLIKMMPEIIKNGFRELEDAWYIVDFLEDLNEEKRIGVLAFIVFASIFIITLLILVSEFLLIFRD